MVSMASFGAVAEFADMLASLTRIDVPLGKEPRKTRAPSVPCKFWMKMKTLGKLVEVEPPLRSLLSNRRTAPLSKETFVIVTVTFAAVGLAWTIAARLMLIVMFPCATTFTNATRTRCVVCKRKRRVDHDARDDGNHTLHREHHRDKYLHVPPQWQKNDLSSRSRYLNSKMLDPLS